MFTDDQGTKRETPEELTIESKLDLILDEMRHLRSAFPKDEDGNVDYDGHRKYHEHLIRAAEAQEAFWNDLKKEVIKKGIIGALIIGLGLVWLGFQAKLGIGPH
jgi:hypothetical protein